MIVVLLFIAAVAARQFGIMRPNEVMLNKFMSSKVKVTSQVIGADLPTQFDTRTAFPGCIHGILDQGQCGSCWAFASTEVLSDRFCIQSSGRVNVVLSPQNALECEKLHYGCTMGSMPEWAWPFLVSHGVSTLSCIPYTSGNGNYTWGGCETKCTNPNTPMTMYYAANYTHVGSLLFPSKHVDEIMRALMQGPLDVTFIVYKDFYQYQPGQVYRHQSGAFDGLHSVKLIGWGQASDGTPYWTVQNSWGPSWGDNGYFKIVRGQDECMIESQVYMGWAKL